MKIEVEMMNNNVDFCEKHSGFERGINGKDNVQSQKFVGKLKGFKNYLICTKHAIFATEPSRVQVTRTSLETPETKFLSVFRD